MPDYGLVTSYDEAKDLADLLAATPERTIGFDVETGYRGDPRPNAATDVRQAFVVGFSITNSPHWARYLPLRHDQGESNLDAESVVSLFRPLLERQLVVAHNASFEIQMMRREGVELNIKSCTLLEAYCMGCYEKHGLKPLVKEIFDHQMAELKSLVPDIKPGQMKRFRFNPLDPHDPAVISYACEDAAWCLAAHRYHWQQLVEGDQRQVFNIELKTMPVVVAMEEAGVGLDFDGLRKGSAEVEAFAEEYRQDVLSALSKATGTDREGLGRLADPKASEAYDKRVQRYYEKQAAGKKLPKWPDPVEMNLGSSQQVSRILFDVMGLPPTKPTSAEGIYSTGSVDLNPLAKKHEIVCKLLTYREITKLNSSYFKKWYTDYDTGTGRAHPGWKQNGVPAGRFSASDPPIQTCPKDFHFEASSGRTLSGNFRDNIVAGPERYLLDFDYSQIELRVIAGMADEAKLKDVFHRGGDPHVLTASLLLNKPEDQVLETDRDSGKTFNFALIYQMGVNSLAKRLGVSQGRAKLLYRRFFEGYSNLHDWIEEQKFMGQGRGYVFTHFGRKVPIFEFQSDLPGVRAHGERLCVNAPVQGTAADIAKMAMYRSAEVLDRKGLYRNGVDLIINNHDELVFEVDKSLDPSELIEVLRPAVEIDLSDEGFPPLVTAWETGQSWGQIQAVK